MWKTIRILILMVILTKAIQQSYAENVSASWQKKLYVAVYPINAEVVDSDAYHEVNAHIKSLTTEDFDAVETYFSNQAEAYQLRVVQPIEMMLGGNVKVAPPAPPNPDNTPMVMLWNVGFQFYSWFVGTETEIKPDVKLYLVYHDPSAHPTLGMSTALYKGRIGRINVYGKREFHDKNLVVLAHELLHTFKATDKYHMHNNYPSFPDGFAEPEKKPLYPQRLTELMGGRLPVDSHHAQMPEKLSETIIGKKTAKEIGWI